MKITPMYCQVSNLSKKSTLLITINIFIYYWRIRVVRKWKLNLQFIADWLELLLFQINSFLSEEMLLFIKECLLSLGLISFKLRNWIYHRLVLWCKETILNHNTRGNRMRQFSSSKKQQYSRLQCEIQNQTDMSSVMTVQ